MSKNEFRYDDTCPDCDSWDLVFSNETEIGNQLHFLVVCRECGSEWHDFIDYWDLDE